VVLLANDHTVRPRAQVEAGGRSTAPISFARFDRKIYANDQGGPDHKEGVLKSITWLSPESSNTQGLSRMTSEKPIAGGKRRQERSAAPTSRTSDQTSFSTGLKKPTIAALSAFSPPTPGNPCLS